MHIFFLNLDELCDLFGDGDPKHKSYCRRCLSPPSILSGLIQLHITLFLSKYLQHFDKSWLELRQLFTGVTENVNVCTSSDISIIRLIASESAAAICYIIMSQSSYIALNDLVQVMFFSERNHLVSTAEEFS